MKNNWPETVDELLEQCNRLIDAYDLYTLGEIGKPLPGETEPRVDGTDYLAGEYQYGVGMIPAQWVTHVFEDSWTCKARLYKPEYGSSDCTICECGEINDISANYCNRCGRRIELVVE